jgi:hypothetical protein
MFEFSANPKKKGNGLLTPIIGAAPNSGNSLGGLGLENIGKGLGKGAPKPEDPAIAARDTNRGILKGLGIEMDTVLTPKGRRKKKEGVTKGNPLRGDTPVEATLGA